MKKIASRASALAASLLLAVAAFFVGTAPASAVVWNCSTGYGSVGAWGKCLAGDTQTYRVNVLCQNIFTRDSYYKGGNWVDRSWNVPSTVNGCGAFEQYVGQPWISTP